MGDEILRKKQLEGYLEMKGSDNGGVYRIVATTSERDRDGDIVVPTGVTNLKDYLGKNPVILFGHNWSGAPIGKAVGGQVNDNRLELQIVFAETDLGKEVKYLYDNGFMNSFSIGFLPIDYEVFQEDEKRGYKFTKWELLEVSAVSIPANSGANILRSAKEAGVELSVLKGMLEGDSELNAGAKGEKAVERKELGASRALEILEIYKKRRRVNELGKIHKTT